VFGNFVITLALFFFFGYGKPSTYWCLLSSKSRQLAIVVSRTFSSVYIQQKMSGSQITNRLLICFYICIVYLMLINIILPLQVQRPDSAMGTNCDYGTWYYCLCNTVTNSRACFTSEKCNVPNWNRYQDLHVHVVQCKPPLYQLS
jgi:phosphatidylglycerophosphate synthase